MTITTLQTILISGLLLTWLIFSLVFLADAIQSFINTRKSETRAVEAAEREKKYTEERSQREKEHADREQEYHEKRMKSLEE